MVTDQQGERIFKDPLTTAAAINRLVHHSVILALNLPSDRLDASKRQIRTAQQPVDGWRARKHEK